MKKMIFGLVVLFCFNLYAKDTVLSNSDTSIFENNMIYCARFVPLYKGIGGTFIVSEAGVSISCVSKASIQKDQLELEVLQLQKQKLEQELRSSKK